jgi:hypothetical protein
MNIYVYTLTYTNSAGVSVSSLCRTTNLADIPSGVAYYTCTGIDMISPIILSGTTYVLDTATILLNAQNAACNLISQQCADTILSGVVSSASGTSLTYTLQDVDQTNFLKASIEANQVLNTAVPWTAGMTVAPLQFIVNNGVYYVNLNATSGTTGTTTPVFPTTYGDTVIDNTVTWIQVFDMFSTTTVPVFLTPIQVKQLFNDASRWILNNRIKAFQLCQQINATTTVSAATAIVWT